MCGWEWGVLLCVYLSTCIYGGLERYVCVCLVLLLHQQAIQKLNDLSHHHFVIAHDFMDQSRLLVLERRLSS